MYLIRRVTGDSRGYVPDSCFQRKACKSCFRKESLTLLQRSCWRNYPEGWNRNKKTSAKSSGGAASLVALRELEHIHKHGIARQISGLARHASSTLGCCLHMLVTTPPAGAQPHCEPQSPAAPEAAGTALGGAGCAVERDSGPPDARREHLES